jgi:membrane dipeptidase
MTTVGSAALALYRDCEVVDMHVETFVWTRIFRYDLTAAHGPGLLRARWFGQADLPRLSEAGLSAVVLSIATNPARRPGARTSTLLANLDRLQRLTSTSQSTPISSATSGSTKRLTIHLAVQGANAFDRPEERVGQMHERHPQQRPGRHEPYVVGAIEGVRTLDGQVNCEPFRRP